MAVPFDDMFSKRYNILYIITINAFIHTKVEYEDKKKPSTSGFTILAWREQDEFEDTKGVIRIRISKKNRQHYGQKNKYKRTNNDLHPYTLNQRSSNRNPTENRG